MFDLFENIRLSSILNGNRTYRRPPQTRVFVFDNYVVSDHKALSTEQSIDKTVFLFQRKISLVVDNKHGCFERKFPTTTS